MNNIKKLKRTNKAVIYTRVSTDDQATKGYSLIDQEEILRKACAHDGVEIVEHFQDDGYSAKTFHHRPGFQRMLGMLKSHQLMIDRFYVVRWDRFSRNIEESYIMIRELRSLGVEVRCLEETLDSSDPASVLLRALKLAEPEMDNRRRAKNTQMGIRRALKDGRYACGAAPIGYSWDRSKVRPTIVPNEKAPLVKEAYEIYASGLYSIEHVRGLMNEKGLNIQKTAFNHMLRNLIYAGKIVIPELGDEEELIIIGIHEAIISEELFQKVQRVLAKILEKNASRIEKINYRDELPLRRLLQCPKCNASWTGSGSTGNGGKYFYYHCQNGCKERIKAEEANLAFSDYLKSFQVHPEVSNLYMVIMEDIFKAKEGDREKEINHYQKSVQELEAKLLKIDEMFVNGDLEKDSYQRMKTSTKDEIQRLQIQLSRLKNTDSNFVKYCRYGLSLLGNLQFHYQQASPHIRKKLLGSIFTGKLIFENGNYRTTGLNKAVALIGQFQQEFGHKKAEHLAISDKTFGNVPFTDLTSNQFIDGMRKIFELEPFINISWISQNTGSDKYVPAEAVASL
jgi:site-specific DNA recombinase